MRLVNLLKRSTKADCSIESAALFDALLIAVMFTLLGSNFIVAPGVELGVVPEQTKGTPADASIDVLSATSGNMLIYKGEIYTPKSFSKLMSSSKGKNSGSTLLIKADKNVSAQSILDICEAARLGGFERVRLAAKPYKY